MTTVPPTAPYERGAMTLTLTVNGKPIFDGVIFKVGIEVTADGVSRFIVDAADRAIKMTLEPRNEVHSEVTDSKLIGKLIARNGLEPRVAETTAKQSTVAQSSISDWDLMLTRSEANALVAIVKACKLTITAPDFGPSPALRVTLGETLLGLRLERDDSSELSAVGLMRPPMGRGHIRFPGSALAETGRTIDLTGLGRHFGGTAFISGVQHSISPDQGWVTTAELGLPAQT